MTQKFRRSIWLTFLESFMSGNMSSDLEHYWFSQLWSQIYFVNYIFVVLFANQDLFSII